MPAISGLSSFDITAILRRLPEEVVMALKVNHGRAFLAGGFIRAVVAHEEVNDIDLIVSSEGGAHALTEQIATLLRAKNAGRVTKVLRSKNAHTIVRPNGAPPIQVVHRWTFNSAHEAIESFDFTIARAAVFFDEAGRAHGICDPSFYADLAARRLVYRNPVRNEDAGGSFLRLLKFYRRGYAAPLTTMSDIIARLTYGVTSKQAMDGKPEGAWAGHLLGLLHEVDPQVDPKHIIHLEDAVEEL